VTSLRLSVFYGAVFLVIGTMMPFWPVWLKSVGLTAEEIGLVFAVSMMMKLISNPLTTQLADCSGHRRVLLIGLSLMASAVYALFLIADGFASVIVISIIFFFFWSPIMPLTESLTMLVGRTERIDYGRVRLWGSLTFIAAAWGMGVVMTDREPRMIIWAVLASVVLTSVAAFTLPATRSPKSTSGGMLFRRVLADRQFVLLVLAASLIQSSHSVYYAFGTLHWKASGHSETMIGWLWAEGVIAEIVLFAFSNTILERIGIARLIALAGLAGTVRWFCTGLTDALPALMVLQILHALTFGAAHLGAVHYISRRMDPSISATAQGLYSAIVMGISMGIMGLVSGHLYAAYAGQAFYVMAGLAGLGSIIAFSLRRRAVADA